MSDRGGRHQFVAGDALAERTVEGLQNAAFGGFDVGAIAVARAAHVEFERGRNPSRTRPHYHDAVGKVGRLFHIVGDQHQRRLERAPQIEHVLMQARAREGIERGEGLVQQQDLRPWRERTRNRHALCLTAGKLARPALRVIGKPDAEQYFGDDRVAFCTLQM
jgi:hypothetical protein